MGKASFVYTISWEDRLIESISSWSQLSSTTGNSALAKTQLLPLQSQAFQKPLNKHKIESYPQNFKSILSSIPLTQHWIITNYSPPWFLFCFSLKLDVSTHLMCDQSSQQSTWETISAFWSGQQLNQWKAAAATITWVVLWLSSYSFTCYNHTYAGWAHTGTVRGSLCQWEQVSDNVTFKNQQWPHKNISQRHKTEPVWKGFLGSHKWIFILGVKATSLVNSSTSCKTWNAGVFWRKALKNLL